MFGHEESDDDARIRREVTQRLTEDEFVDAHGLEVTVHHAAVTLTGSVGSVGQGHRAAELAARVHGVAQVIDRLGLRRSAQAAQAMGEIGSSPADPETRTPGVVGDMDEPATLKEAHTNSLTRR